VYFSFGRQVAECSRSGAPLVTASLPYRPWSTSRSSSSAMTSRIAESARQDGDDGGVDDVTSRRQNIRVVWMLYYFALGVSCRNGRAIDRRAAEDKTSIESSIITRIGRLIDSILPCCRPALFVPSPLSAWSVFSTNWHVENLLQYIADCNIATPFWHSESDNT